MASSRSSRDRTKAKDASAVEKKKKRGGKSDSSSGSSSSGSSKGSRSSSSSSSSSSGIWWLSSRFLQFLLFFSFSFLDAPSHLYKRLCPSVRRSVRRSVRPSVGPSVCPVLYSKVISTHTLTVLMVLQWSSELKQMCCVHPLPVEQSWPLFLNHTNVLMNSHKIYINWFFILKKKFWHSQQFKRCCDSGHLESGSY